MECIAWQAYAKVSAVSQLIMLRSTASVPDDLAVVGSGGLLLILE